MFEPYLHRWKLTPEGEPLITPSSRLLPVRWGNTPAMLKIAVEAEEKWGGFLMAWWGGQGAAQVFEMEGEALLMERALGKSSLEGMVRQGYDEEASRIICRVAATLHAPRPQPPPDLIPLSHWFRALAPAAAKYGGPLLQSALVAHDLLENPRGVSVLHGDIHHGNILDFEERGWLAVDPKRLVGERGFDFANIFCNPTPEIALAPGRLNRQVGLISEAANVDRRRLLQWIVAWAGLSAAWSLEEGHEPKTVLGIADLAASALTQ